MGVTKKHTRRPRLSADEQSGDSRSEEEEEAPSNDGGAYFLPPRANVDFIHSGSTLLDCVLGGGWPLGRVSNIIGDKATGKTLLAIEACANALRQFPDANIWYAESEAAFDANYAESLGVPVNNIEFPEGISTVEDVFEHLEEVAKLDIEHGVYVVDSLDALTDRSEQGRKIDEDSMGTGKSKKMSELFRRRIQLINQSNIHFMFVSQIRDKINPGFGKKTTRSGGHALDFYASQIIEIAHKGRIEKTHKGVTRKIGVDIAVSNEKNKVGMPFRKCEFPIRFGYGVDDLKSCLEWLLQTGNQSVVGLNQKDLKTAANKTMTMPDDEFNELMATCTEEIPRLWHEIDAAMAPRRQKY